MSIPKTRTHKSVIGQLRKKYGLKDNTPIHKVEQIMTPKDWKTFSEALTFPNGKPDNCSGKHIGMLLFCKLLDLEIENYQEITHPIQQKIDLFYRELFNLEKITYGIDGCGLPAPYINSNIFLSSVSKLNNSKIYEESWKIIFNAFYSHPVHTAGSDRVDTILMQNSPNDVLIKAGAEGSMFFTDLKKSTLLKCKDGSKRGVDIASMYFGLKSSYIDETTNNQFIKSFTHNNQNTKVADVKILEK